MYDEAFSDALPPDTSDEAAAPEVQPPEMTDETPVADAPAPDAPPPEMTDDGPEDGAQGTQLGIIKVSGRSRSTAVAGAIAAVMREQRFAEVQAIGAGAVNQAVKALAICRGYLEQDEIDIVCIPMFIEVTIGGQERTALRFQVEERTAKRED